MIMEPYKSLLNQLDRMSRDGSYGTEAQDISAEYSSYSKGVQSSLKYILDYYNASEVETKDARDYFVQILVVVYREAKKKDEAAALSFLMSFINDYRGTVGSALLPKWVTLGDAIREMKRVGQSGGRTSIWQTSSRIVLYLNEFLDGLLGLLIVSWRVCLRKSVNLAVLANAYGSKVREFSDLTGGNDGVFYLFLRLAKPDLRNALAHGTAWPDYDAGKIRYVAGRHDKTKVELDMPEFMVYVKLAADLAQGYIAALNTILVFETGDDLALSLMPQHLRSVWSG